MDVDMLPNQFFKMLSDETRLRCLILIAREDRVSVGELCIALEQSQPKISRHLAILRQSGVLLDQREGQWVYYKVNSELPGWMRKVISGLTASNCLKAEYQQDIEKFQLAKQIAKTS
ncbi:metalloregulator ArsR/SmtB family transcription factor [Psychromonas arctica]|uniref:metalloregulator ArsR/SmtB family transcription factor n=2 Tax=Psychromonas TaxID=67572 RepID=UPI001FDECB12|nr:metalloregulator ArsR/SmtB family transcription factor [Psychromonas arctica]